MGLYIFYYTSWYKKWDIFNLKFVKYIIKNKEHTKQYFIVHISSYLSYGKFYKLQVILKNLVKIPFGRNINFHIHLQEN